MALLGSAPSALQILETIDLFSAAGVEVAISELDLDLLPPAWSCLSEPGGVCRRADHDADWATAMDPYGATGRLPLAAAQEQQRRFGDLFAAFLSRSAAVSRVTFWWVALFVQRDLTTPPCLALFRARQRWWWSLSALVVVTAGG